MNDKLSKEPLSLQSDYTRLQWKEAFYKDCAIGYHSSCVENINQTLSRCLLQLINIKAINELHAIGKNTIDRTTTLLIHLSLLSSDKNIVEEQKRVQYMHDIIYCDDSQKLKEMFKDFDSLDITPVLSTNHCSRAVYDLEHINFISQLVRDNISCLCLMEEVIDLISIAKDAIKSCLVSELYWTHRIENESLMLKYYLIHLSNEDRCKFLTNDVIDKYGFGEEPNLYNGGKSLTECMIIQPIPR